MRSAAESRPLSLQLILTSACNLDCAYCYQERRGGESTPWRFLRAALDLLIDSRNPTPTVSFHGGEPLLNFHTLQRCVEYLEGNRPPSMRPRYFLNTNGTLLDDDNISFLKRNNFQTALSFDGIREAHDARAPGTFEELDRCLRRIREAHPSFFHNNLLISMTVWSGNLRYLARSVEYFLELGVQSIALNPLITHDAGWHGSSIKALDEQFAQVDEFSREHLARTGETPVSLLRRTEQGDFEESMKRFRCGAMSGHKITVDVDGRMYPCILLASSYQEFPDGLLRDPDRSCELGSIEEPEFWQRIEKTPELARRAGYFVNKPEKYSLYGRCGECRFLESCFVCPISIGHIPGNNDPDRVPDHACAFNLIAHKYRAEFPSQAGKQVVTADEPPTPLEFAAMLADLQSRLSAETECDESSPEEPFADLDTCDFRSSGRSWGRLRE